jgi:HD-like signal output (HDOD) protein
MLQDFGLLTMFLICPENGKDCIRLRDSNPDDRQFLEMELFGATHDAVGGIIADNWGLPEQLSIPIAYHHAEHIDDFTLELQKMTLVATCADWMAAVFTVSDKRLALAKCHKLIMKSITIDAVMKSIMAAADKAMYQSKQGGRNMTTWETLNPSA